MRADRLRCAALLEVLESSFADCRSGRTKLWAIVDPASYPAAWLEFGRVPDRSVVKNLFEDTPQSQDQSVSPLLISFKEIASEIQPRLIEVAMEHPAVVWLASDLVPQRLAKALSRKFSAEIPERQPITLRYCDPRVLPELWRVLNAQQQALLAEGVQAWWWLDRQNELQRWSFKTSPSKAPAAGEPTIALTDAQVHALLDASFPDRVMNLLARTTTLLPKAFDRAQRHTFVTSGISSAGAFGLVSEMDCAQYIGVALQQGPDFASQESWEPLMNAVATKQLSFSDAIVRWEADHA
jgi:Domain of unknown function (DUF4123)